MATCLSPGKRRLVCDVGSGTGPGVTACYAGRSECFDGHTGLVSWRCVNELGLHHNEGSKTEEESFEDGVAHLAPFCHTLHEWVLSLGDEDLQDKYAPLLQWTGNPQLFLDCFKLVRSGDGVGTSLSLLLSSSTLERALGDVFKLKSKEPCPAMLKHLFSTQELGDVFGENAITLLRILVGPPTSLNLRNLLWHGFAAPDEIPPRYSSFLLIVAACLGRLLTDRGIMPDSIPHRKPLHLPQVDSEAFRHIFPEIHQVDVKTLWELYSTTAFFHRPMLPYCKAALDFFQESKYGVTLVLLLPQLENGLRRLFTVANKCPERFVSSESDYFTTFDEMLCSVLPGEIPNALITAIGKPYMELLLDILVHPEGPRLRDHVSHGELDLRHLPRACAGHLLALCAAFCLQGCQDDALLQVPLLSKIQVAAQEYESLYHPVSLLRQDLLTLVGSLSRWSELSRPDAESVGYQTWSSSVAGDPENVDLLDAAKTVLDMHPELLAASGVIHPSVVMPFSELDKLQQFIHDLPVKTLFRPRREVEVSSLLLRIACRCVAACRNVTNTAELRHRQHLAKELRSRQRANYVRLLNSIPRVSGGLRLVALLLVGQLSGVHNIVSLARKDAETLIKFLKGILRFSENLDSLSSPERNRWDECRCLTDSLLQQIKSYSAKVDKTGHGQ